MECAICFESAEESNIRLMAVPCERCKTSVHGECLVDWLIRNGTCPVCRESVMIEERDREAQLPVSFEAVVQLLSSQPMAPTVVHALWFVASTTFSVCMPWFFFFTDVVVSFAGFLHLFAGHAMPRAIVSCLTGSVFLHVIFFVATSLHAIIQQGNQVQRERARLQSLTVAGVGALLTLPLFLDHEKGLAEHVSEGISLSSNLHVLGMEAAIYLCLTYALMFVMTIPAMIHPRPVWKVNYLCERIMFVCILSGMRSIADTRTLLALTSFSGILMSGVIFAME